MTQATNRYTYTTTMRPRKKLAYKIILLLVLMGWGLTSPAQQKLNLELKKELEEIYALDQKFRVYIGQEFLPQKKLDSLAKAFSVSKEAVPKFLWEKQNQLDAANIKRVKEIIQQWGYPGRSLVGSPTNEVAYKVLQHTKEADSYLPAIREAAEKKELPFTLYATMLDKSMMQKNKEQLYGTQAHGFSVYDADADEYDAKIIIWPIKDPDTVNERRKAAGFELTVEENAQRLGVEYVVLTMEEVKEMKSR
ncbi:DUF6624 domain-containing protein [Cesiribacter sp. SM1]|uniref:DUF6624 domain-containing protein n=1 Tax=Cesiribacter sp. SM1 TaxID=2861196 RepID=UPI001CD4C14C|nr:DUF6624 domain-containing protein [Cesiribacter sp. SM1]